MVIRYALADAYFSHSAPNEKYSIHLKYILKANEPVSQLAICGYWVESYRVSDTFFGNSSDLCVECCQKYVFMKSAEKSRPILEK